MVNKKANGSVIDSYSYMYDGAHNQTSKTDSKGVTNYEYDSLNRLEKVTEPNGRTTSYTFDQAGNRLTETVLSGTTSVTTTYSYNEQNRLCSTVKQSGNQTISDKYMYDNNGNTISKTTETVKPVDPTKPGGFSLNKAGQSTTSEVTNYKFDVWNQLVKTVTGQKIVTYSYNGEGYRVSKSENNQKTNYLYEGDKVILETDGTGNQTAKNVYGLNLLTRTSGSDTMNYMYNGHGDVTALLGTDGTIKGTYYYDAFGNILEQTGNVNNTITYAGYQYDKETDLYYLNARYYDSKIARFINEDTYLGDPNDVLSLNLYTYCANNPVKYIDPSGHVYLTNGSKGDDVKVIQAALGVPVTGVYDKKTEDAVNKYKTENKLGNTGASEGVVGDQTYASIISGKVVSVKETKAMQEKAGTSSSSSSYGLSSSTIAGTVGVSDSVSKKVSDAIATGAPDSLDVTIGKSIVSSAKPTNFVNPESLFHTSDFKLKPEVQQMITYYDDMYLHANVAYINNIIKDYEYKALSSFTKEKVQTLRNSNSFEEVDDLTYQIICALGSFIPIAGSLFDVLGDTQPVYAADLSSLAIEKMSNPQYMAIITRAITENVNIKQNETAGAVAKEQSKKMRTDLTVGF